MSTLTSLVSPDHPAQVKKRLLSVPGISLLTSKDEPILRSSLSGQHTRYSHSWLYILRASFFGVGQPGCKYISDGIAAVIGYRMNHIYIYVLYDSSRGSGVQALCHKIHTIVNAPIFLKKFDPTLYPNTLYSLPNAERLHLLEDDSQPETVLNLRKLFTTPSGQINPVAQKLLRRAQSFERNHPKLDVITSIPLVPLEALSTFLRNDTQKYAHYRQIIEHLHSLPEQEKETPSNYPAMIFMHGKEIKGIYAAEHLSAQSSGLYVALSDASGNGITESMDLHFLRYLASSGVETVYLGGSEKLGVADYISKLIPYRPSYDAKTVLFRQNPTHTTKKNPLIRSARKSDFNQLSTLYKEVYNSLGTLGETWTKQTARKFISHFYNRQPDLFFVAVVDQQVIGAVVAAVQPWWDGNHLVEGELFVADAYKNSDLSRQLLRTMLVKARKQYHAVAWDTLTPNIHEHPLGEFEKMGFKKVPYWTAVSGDIHTVLNTLGSTE